MASRPDGVPVAELRDALKRAIAAASLRSVAAEVGMSPSGLRTFVARGRPHPRTVYVATAWFVRRSMTGMTDPSTAKAGVAVLTGHLSANAKKKAALKIREILREASRRDRKPIPEWVRDLD
jgi:hypothetical protein